MSETRIIKGFVVRDDFINNTTNVVSPAFELSNFAMTFTKDRKIYTDETNSKYSLYVFNDSFNDELPYEDYSIIIKVIDSFVSFFTTTNILDPNEIRSVFINNFNYSNPINQIVNFDFFGKDLVNYLSVPYYVTFTIRNINCIIWLNNEHFIEFYPDYEIDVVLPFDDFENVLFNTPEFLNRLANFDLLKFNDKLEDAKGRFPTTYDRILNIPYKVPNTNIFKNCYFGFNIYGIKGRYENILKLSLFNYLTNVLGLNANSIIELFPSILEINEFFIIPRWDRIAIPTQIGKNGLNSQITSAYNEAFDINIFVKANYSNEHFRTNTYFVPFDYNNIILSVVNGEFSDSEIKDFKKYYSDLITVTSIHPDFARMSVKTQKFVTMLHNMLKVCDSDNENELFLNIIANKDYDFNILNRGDINYVVYLYEDHLYYVIPKYEYYKLLGA